MALLAPFIAPQLILELTALAQFLREVVRRGEPSIIVGDVAVSARTVLDIPRCFALNGSIGLSVMMPFDHQRCRFVLNGG